MPPTCTISGNSDMYGLGIRIGYYLQWYGLLVAPYISPKEVATLRLTDAFFVSATFLALLIQVSKSTLDIVEIYIVLLFTFGSNLYLLPVLLWRVVCRCDPKWDPSRFPRVPVPSRRFQRLHGALTIAVFAFQLWFWGTKAGQLDGKDCTQYGFIFSKMSLDAVGFRAVNMVVCALILLLVTTFWAISLLPSPEWFGINNFQKLKQEREFTPKRVQLFNAIDTGSKLFIATAIVTATELSIHWNSIQNVNSIDSAGQIIPLLIGILSVVRMLYKAAFGKEEGRDGLDLEADIEKPPKPHEDGKPPGSEGPAYLNAMPSPWYDAYSKTPRMVVPRMAPMPVHRDGAIVMEDVVVEDVVVERNVQRRRSDPVLGGTGRGSNARDEWKVVGVADTREVNAKAVQEFQRNLPPESPI